jgi:FKBP-type peptidyl-prolyl cis-trans isomerase FkpA
MKRNFLLLGLAALGFVSCDSGFKKGEGGLMYKIHSDKDGPTIKEGDFISARVVTKREDDSVLYSTYDVDITSEVKVNKPTYSGDLFAGIMKLSEGDSATIKVDLDSASLATGQPKPPIFKGKYIVYDLKIVKVIPKGTLSDEEMETKISEFYKEASEKAQKAESGKIEKYIADKKLDVVKTNTGLNYAVTKEGNGEKPAVGDTVEVNYTMHLFSGKVFDTSSKEVAEKEKIYDARRDYKPLRIAVGVGQVIAGWDEGLQLLSKGSKATLVVPSALAYGEQGAGQTIPPFVNIIKPTPGSSKPLEVTPLTQPAKK